MNSETILLVPTPRKLKALGGYRPWPRVPNVNAHEETLGAFAARRLGGQVSFGRQADVLIRLEEGRPRHAGEYSMRIELSGAVRIVARDRAGCLHAIATLKQLMAQFGDRLPLAIIEDYPSFPHRGVMLDVSRDRVPKMDELLRIVGQLADLKVNHLQLYTEHTFAYPGHEAIWGGVSPVTADEVRRVDEACREHGITLAANQNCFGHLASWLKHPAYRHLAEIPGLEDVWQFYAWERKGPFSLCPTDPKAATFVDGLLGELLPHFSSGLCNINCDETADVGQGRSKQAVAERGRAAVYFDFLDSVVESVRRRGFRPMFWADIALSQPEGLERIPADMVCLAWDYEPEARFRLWCETLRGESQRETWVCPGTSSWRSFTGRTTERRGNISAAAGEGLVGGATGLLVCDWGDVGHRQTWPISMHGMVNGAQAAWAGSAEASEELLAAESLHVFEDRALAIGAWLEAFGDVDRPLRLVGGAPAADGSPTALKNATLMFHDYHLPWGDASRRGELEMWRRAEEALAEVAGAMPGERCPVVIRDELEHSVRCARAALRRGVLRRTDAPVGKELLALADSIREIQREQPRLWGIRSRSGGLSQSMSHDAKALEELQGMLGTRGS
jgi:hypothetical protein